LREPLTGLARADVVALSRADLLDAPGRAEIAARAAQLAPEALWIEVAHRPTSLLRSDGEVRPVDDLAGRPVAAVCAIGNPAGFRHTLARCGFDVIAQRTFPDHHQFSDRDRRDLAQWADTCDRAEAIVCTHKDLVKLAAPQLGQRPLWALQIGIDVVAGRPALEQGLTGLL